MFRRFRTRLLPCVLAACALASARAQDGQPAALVAPAAADSGAPSPAQALSLKQVFDLAWARQPELLSQATRREAVDAGRRAASSWSAEPASVELLGTTDQIGSNLGRRDIEAAVSVPLWLPGERQHAGRLADAESGALDARLQTARLKLAATVRTAWWAVQRATLQVDLARDRSGNTRQLAADVARRFAAGDLSRADQVLAEAAAVQADLALAEATADQLGAQLALRGLIGDAPATTLAALGTDAESVPELAAEPVGAAATHPALADLVARAEVARQAADLAAVQTRANPELRLATTRERGQVGEAYRQSVSVGLRFAFGAGPRADARAAAARAEQQEAEGLVTLERARLSNDIDAARARVDASRLQLDGAQRRARLAGELRGFVDKSFRLGESDLPTRLRVEAEAAEAERQVARTRIELAAAISAWRQALGLLPQ